MGVPVPGGESPWGALCKRLSGTFRPDGPADSSGDGGGSSGRRSVEELHLLQQKR